MAKATKKKDKKKPAKAEVPGQPDPNQYWTDHQLVTATRTRELQRECDKLKEEMDSQKDIYKGKKSEWEASRAAKDMFIRQRAVEFQSKRMAVQQPTLTRDVEHTEDAKKARDEIVKQVADSMKMPTDAPKAGTKDSPYDRHGVHGDAYMLYPIAKLKYLGLADKTIEAMRDPQLKRGSDQIAPIVTMGDLAAFVSPNPANPSFSRQLTDLKGIGPEAATKFGDVQEKLLAEWDRGTISIAFAKELVAKDGKYKHLFQSTDPNQTAEAPAGKKLRGGGAKPQAKGKKDAKPKPGDAEANGKLGDDGADGEPVGASTASGDPELGAEAE